MTNLPEEITRLRLADENGFSYSDYMHHFPKALEAIEQLIALVGVAHEALEEIALGKKCMTIEACIDEAARALKLTAPIVALMRGGE